MKKLILLFSVVLIGVSCSIFNKYDGPSYKQVNEREVPDRYVKDLKSQRPNATQVRWEMVDSLTYNAKLVDNGNNVRVKYSKNATETHWIIPKEYVPSDITDHIKEAYADFKIHEVYIADIRNKKVYRAGIYNKKDYKLLEFNIQGKFTTEIRL